MVRDTPVLKKLVADPKARDSGNTKLHKKFIGGHITIAGANFPASLAARPIRVVLCDKVDRYPDSPEVKVTQSAWPKNEATLSLTRFSSSPARQQFVE